jgi:cellulose synthase/poly-beta-1,6-N-acetylglucosamine synthase-like glycosyltransferase
VLVLPLRTTVGICAYNEGNNIGKLLSNVLNDQELSEDSEVVVVCSGCLDNTEEVVHEYAAKDLRVKPHFEKERKGKASAVNYILANATGDAILFISADTLPRKGTFSKLLSKLEQPQVGLVCGNPSPVNGSNSMIGRIVHLMWRFHSHVFEELNDAGLARHASEAFCMRKGIVEKIPSETVNDDAFIAVNVKKKGWLIKFCPDSYISICGPKTFQEYFQQRRRVVFGHYQIRKLTGASSQYLVHMLPLQPRRSIRLALWLCTKYDPFTLATFLVAEFVINGFALFDFGLGKTYSQWASLPSTKTVIPQV